MFGREHVEFGHFSQHQIAALARTFRVPARVVVTRPFDHGHQQRRLRQRQLLERLAKVEWTRKANTVNGAITILAEVDFVQVSLKNIALVVVQFEQQRHQDLGRLAPQGAFRRQKKILHQLLGERAATLHAASGDRAHQGTPHTARVNAVVFVEFSILDGNQCLHQLFRHLIESHQQPIFVVRRINATDVKRIEPREGQRLITLHIVHRLQRLAAEIKPQRAGRLRAIPEHERPRLNLETVAAPRVPAGFIPGKRFLVAKARQFLD